MLDPNKVEKFEVFREDLTKFVSLIQNLPFRDAAPILNLGDTIFRPIYKAEEVPVSPVEVIENEE